MFEQELDMYWKAVVNTMMEGLMIVDPDGTIVSVNKALEKMTGFLQTELVGKQCSVLNCSLFQTSRKNRGGTWCTLFNQGFMDTKRCTLQRKNKSIIHVLKNAAILKDNRGKVIGGVETITDITDIIEKDTQIEAYRKELFSDEHFHGIIGDSEAMRRVFDLVSNAARSDAPVIIFGESGTGKELVSRAVHAAGNRNNGPFVKVNCAALQDSLLESELFGHVKGAFTGAYKDRRGRFESADNGDIFLDEIGDIPVGTQVKMLRVLEEKTVERVGSGESRPVNVRIISATNRNLEKMVEKGEFRKDFFFRINVIPIHIPPLRDRKEDIPLIAQSFFEKIRLKSGRKIKAISKETMDILLEHPWPGNVRELKSAFEYAFVTCDDTLIRPPHLPASILNHSPEIKKAVSAADGEKKIKHELIKALEKTGGNRTAAARLLGVSRVTVWNRMKKFNISAKTEIRM
ncbi:sigma 54-interacting transcriptional regulator [Desulfococcaceae bacterium HSG7]|nr:sigma 54-interacting transcriptional regulator [Desulfococcaceae bacterium HSG7]